MIERTFGPQETEGAVDSTRENKLSHEELDDICSKNDVIIDSLERNLQTVSHGMWEEMESSEANGFELYIKPLYEMTRAVLDNALYGMACILPEDLEEYRSTLDEQIQYLDVIDAFLDDLPLSHKEKVDLSFNIRQHIKDYLYGIYEILKSNPEIDRKEMIESIEIMSDNLRDLMLLRAGCTPDNINDDRDPEPSDDDHLSMKR